MPKMIVSIDGVVIKEVQLTKDRTTLGRRPYNDIVIDNLAISGEHALFQMAGKQVYLEDLNSTNGSYVNGKAVKKQLLQNGDTVEVGKYQSRFVETVTSDVPAARAPAAPRPSMSLPSKARAFARRLSRSSSARAVAREKAQAACRLSVPGRIPPSCPPPSTRGSRSLASQRAPTPRGPRSLCAE